MTILKTYKLSPDKYEEMFSAATKLHEETFVQFANRLSVNLNYYIKAREIGENDLQLFNLPTNLKVYLLPGSVNRLEFWRGNIGQMQIC